MEPQEGGELLKVIYATLGPKPTKVVVWIIVPIGLGVFLLWALYSVMNWTPVILDKLSGEQAAPSLSINWDDWLSSGGILMTGILVFLLVYRVAIKPRLDAIDAKLKRQKALFDKLDHEIIPIMEENTRLKHTIDKILTQPDFRKEDFQN